MPLCSSNMLKYKTNIALLKSIKANANVSLSLNTNCIYKYAHNINCPTDLTEMSIHNQRQPLHPTQSSLSVLITVITWLMQYYSTAGCIPQKLSNGFGML